MRLLSRFGLPVFAIVLVALGLEIAGCANPVPPSGGPRDETPPSVLRTTPARDAVNVPTSTRSIRIEFSEYVERSSFAPALTVTPAFDERLRLDWDGTAVTIELPQTLRDSTTYLFTLDTNLSDARGVSLEDPVTVAFATGPRIDRGALSGSVVEPVAGEAQSGIDVYAYALSSPASAPPDSLPDRPAYRTQTGEDGTFAFDYLREQRYFVLAVQDNNRNRQLDDGEAFAVPPAPSLQADSAAGALPVPWLLAAPDTTGPAFQRATPLTQQRVRLRFNEAVALQTRTPSAWRLRDSTAGTDVAVQAVFQQPDAPQEVLLRTAPMRESVHALPLMPGLLADSLGQPLQADTARFTASARADTFRTRLRTFIPTSGTADSTGAFPILGDARPGARFTQAPTSGQAEEALVVQDTTGQPLPFSLSSDDGVTYRVRLDPPLAPGAFADLLVRGSALAEPDTTYRRRYRRVTQRALGELEGRAVLADTARRAAPSPRASSPEVPARPNSLRPDSLQQDSLRQDSLPQDSLQEDRLQTDTLRADSSETLPTGPVVVELIPDETTVPMDSRTLTVPADSTFLFEGLPEGSFRFRAFLDRNENGRWDPGRLRPYRPAEPITWRTQPVDSRPRWTTVLPAPLRIVILQKE